MESGDIHPTAFIHPLAQVESGASIGARTRVWAFAHILPGARIGDDCNICDHTFIEGGVVLGARVTVKCGVFLWDGLVIGDDVFLGPNATFTNDLRPRSRQPYENLTMVLQNGCSIGANSTVVPGLTIGQWAMVGAGSVVTRNVPAFALVAGNPARKRAWVCLCGRKLDFGSQQRALCACGNKFKLTTTDLVERDAHEPV